MSAATGVHPTWPPAPSARGRQNAPEPRRWAWRAGRVFGVDVYIHATFLLLLAWVAFNHRAAGASGIGRGLALVLCIFGIVVLHELGHSLVARDFGIRTRDITLLPIGGVSHLERMPEKPIEELLVSLAGPAVNIVLALALWAGLTVTGASVGPREIGTIQGSFLAQLMWANVSLAVFNLMPAFPMDGGRVLRAALAIRLGRRRATEIAARLGQGMALLFAVAGLFYSPMLLFIAVFVWLGARQEFTMAALKHALSGIPIESAMVTDFRVLAPLDRLSAASALIVAGFQHDFPVVDGRRLVGVLTRQDVVRGLSEHGADALVASAMHRDVVTAPPTDLLETVLTRQSHPEQAPVVVVREGTVVGLVNAEILGEFILLRRAEGSPPPSHPSR